MHCQVVEEAGAVTTKDSRTMMVKFNEQVEPLYVLLREVEDIKLSQEILKPEPMELNVAKYMSFFMLYVYSCRHCHLQITIP